jgi:hypothetical protein
LWKDTKKTDNKVNGGISSRMKRETRMNYFTAQLMF